MTGKLTRRELAAAALSAPVVLAQAPNPPIPQNAEDELKAAREQNRRISEQLAQFPLPMATEPATHFKA